MIHITTGRLDSGSFWRLPCSHGEAVVAEACHLARRIRRRHQEDVLDLVRRGVLEISFSLADEADRVRALAEKYRDLPMSLADACLVRMSELHRGSVVFTLDRDFTVYRRYRRQAIALLSPHASGPSPAPRPNRW